MSVSLFPSFLLLRISFYYLFFFIFNPEASLLCLLFQAIPQYAIPCHSSSNVVVEPSGLLELNNFTSQQLDDDETAMEQDIDSSTEDGTEPSPSQSSAERS